VREALSLHQQRGGAKRCSDTEFNGMLLIPGGTFRMGSDKHYPEEAPVHREPFDTSARHVGFRCIVRKRSTS
jgi:formylglycine-generating enzyme required for sulfatase activity